MLARTELMNGARDSYEQECAEQGYNIMLLSVSGHCCDACAKYEGQYFSIGPNKYGLPTKDDLEAEGVFHPNCTHSYSAVPDYIIEKEFGKAEEKTSRPTSQTSPTSQTVKQRGAQDVRKNERFETVGINLQNPDPYPQDDKHRKLRPVYNAIRQSSETDFTRVITAKGANMNREFIGVYDSSGKPFWIGMGPKDVGAANFPELPKGCTFIHNHPNGGTFSTADIQAFIEHDMTRMVASVREKDSEGNDIIHKYTLIKKDSGSKLPVVEIKQRVNAAIENGNSEFEAWKAALHGTCYEISYD